MDQARPTRRRRWTRRPTAPIAIISCALALCVAQAARAADARFSVDRGQDLAELARTGQVVISIERVRGVYTLDASAVLLVDARQLLRVSLNYERYPEIGVPNLRASHVVAGAPDADVLHTWSWMSCLGQSSKHYLAVRVVRTLAAPGAVGIRWELVPRQPTWPYEDAPAFQRLEGSWYLEPLAGGAVYVRYYAVAALDPSFPEGLRAWAVKGQLREGTRGVVQALAQEAARTH